MELMAKPTFSIEVSQYGTTDLPATEKASSSSSSFETTNVQIINPKPLIFLLLKFFLEKKKKKQNGHKRISFALTNHILHCNLPQKP
jgi:hypothetical protein